MNHGVGYLNSGREAIEHEPANLALENRNKVGKVTKIFCRTVNRRGEVALQRAGNIEDLIPIRMAYKKRGWTKYFRIKI